MTTVDHARSLEVFVHELGHSFAGLADEYYTTEVSYNDFYPKGVEPLEPNITALLDPANVKWKELLSPGIGVPTEYGKDRDRGPPGRARRATQSSLGEGVAAAKAKGADAAEVKAIQDRAAADKDVAGPRSRRSAKNTPGWPTRSASSRGPGTRPRGSTGRRSTAS